MRRSCLTRFAPPPSQATANRSFHLSRARALSPTLASRSSTSLDPSLSSLSSLLSGMALAHAQSQSALVAAFEQRNAALWSSIESAIKQAEHEEGEKQRLLEESSKRGEEAERKAKEMREAAERKAKEEAEEAAKVAAEEKKKRADEAEARKAEDLKRLEEERKAAEAAANAPPPAGSVKVVAPGSAEAGSPQAEWERWAAKMTVSILLCLNDCKLQIIC